MPYKIEIEKIEDEGEILYLAYLPAFGKSACSFADDTKAKAFRGLLNVKKDVIDYYKSIDRELPKEDFVYKEPRYDEVYFEGLKWLDSL